MQTEQSSDVKREVAKSILGAMEERKVTKAALARRLQTSRANVSQMLSGEENLTLETLCKIMVVLKMRIVVQIRESE